MKFKEYIKLVALIIITSFLIAFMLNRVEKRISVESITNFVLDVKDEVEQTIEERESN